LLAPAGLAPLGEATHGTDEFYRERAEITKCLVAEHGVAAVAVEADSARCVYPFLRTAAPTSH
jgi:erythromycin esterase-like protein